MAEHVFEEDPSGLDLPDDPGDVGPEVALVGGAGLFPGRAERLAGIAGEDRVEGAAEGATVEGLDIVPDRGVGEIPGAHGADEHVLRGALSLDETGGLESGLGEHEAQIEAAATCAERETSPGTYTHAIAHRLPKSPEKKRIQSAAAARRARRSA